MSEAQGMETGATVEGRDTTDGIQLDGGQVEKRASGTTDSKKEAAAQQEPATKAPKKAWFKKAEKKPPTEEELQEAAKKKIEGATFGNYLVYISYFLSTIYFHLNKYILTNLRKSSAIVHGWTRPFKWLEPSQQSLEASHCK